MLRFLSVCSALSVGVACGAADASQDEVKAALGRATDYLRSIATEGGYLWRYSEDLQQRRGESDATPSQIWVQPPGTPTVGMTFLQAYDATGQERHFAAAKAAALALVRGQLESGGWTYLVEFDPKARRQWAYRTDAAPAGSPEGRRRNVTTFDDDNTQSALRFLLAFLDVAKGRGGSDLDAIRVATDFGLKRMLEAQYPNGAWPQGYDGAARDPDLHRIQAARMPTNWSRTWTKTNYWIFYTLNDHTQRDCLLTMLDAFKRSGNRDYLASALKGGDFLIRAQLPEPQPAWAQQYNFDLEPAWARAFEPPAVCTAESAGVIRTLLDLFLETGQEKFLRPIPAAIAWLKRSEIAPGNWSRFYELGTNRPIYGDRDGKIHYDLSEISAERRNGYGWRGRQGVPEAIAYYEAVQNEGRSRMLARRREQPLHLSLQADVNRILAAHDSKGRWLTNRRVEMRVFNANMRTLADYLRLHPGGVRAE